MNKSQQLFLNSVDSAARASIAATPAELELFKAQQFTQQGGKSADYPAWCESFEEIRGRLNGLAGAKTPSEQSAPAA